MRKQCPSYQISHAFYFNFVQVNLNCAWKNICSKIIFLDTFLIKCFKWMLYISVLLKMSSLTWHKRLKKLYLYRTPQSLGTSLCILKGSRWHSGLKCSLTSQNSLYHQVKILLIFKYSNLKSLWVKLLHCCRSVIFSGH